MVDAPRGTVQQTLTTTLRVRLEEGELVPGDRLGEVWLAEHHAVSRPTVRTALQELARLGLVTREPGRGAVVNAIDPEEALMLYRLRSQLEPTLVRRFTEQSAPSQMAAYRAATRAFEVAVDAGELPPARVALDRFYRSLLDGAGSWALESAVEVEHAMLTVFRSRTFDEAFQIERLRRAVGVHRRILPHMLARDGAAAQRVCAQHMLEDAAAAMRVLRDGEDLAS